MSVPTRKVLFVSVTHRRHHPLPDDVSLPLDSYLGVFRSRRTIAVGAGVLAFLCVAVHDLPASAATVKHDVFVSESQGVTASIHTFGPIATREEFLVTEFTPVQWPLAPSTDVSSGFGWRVAPCSWGCSSDHQGVDFDPGYGAAIHVIADGVVVESTSDGGLGQHLIIRHDIDGKMVETVYGHMIFGSQTVAVGQKVKMGQIIGRVGSTGASTGPHLHFEVRPGGGNAIEPLMWLHKHVTEAWKG